MVGLLYTEEPAPGIFTTPRSADLHKGPGGLYSAAAAKAAIDSTGQMSMAVC